MTTPAHYDYVVIGCGTIGPMALWQLTELVPGASLLGIERFDRVHTKGSYSGESRLIRVALKEGGIYIPLVQQAREMWLEMNERSGRDIFLPVSAISVGPADLPTMVQTMEVIEEFGLDYEVLDAAELAERFPVFAEHITGFLPENLPIFMRDIVRDNGEIWHCYNAPTIDGYSVKISHGDFVGEDTTTDDLEVLRSGEVSAEVLQVFSERASACFKGLLDAPVRIWLHHDGFPTDHAPVLGQAPGSDGAVTVDTGVSGNGMKFAPVYGRIAAELAVTGDSPLRPAAFDYPVAAREPSAAIIPATIH